MEFKAEYEFEIFSDRGLIIRKSIFSLAMTKVQAVIYRQMR